ncbi:hypothetical protein PGT21_024750 [Puccinia graminis f. sp. tritici]|uniref:Uncharacterized protein n=1 Tax=Puccinia graminis f. sp. tritici TaxID=56615 RepID=A0A5B0NB04_PUCGR|nr:hypothetical protein PGT21_024750 [Puccinia graminis f. sp. tritici]KAA1113776.1 hypothetical protein PGTUg99_018946 [Puccinia graminis f. sp. tritici]
MVNAEGEPVEYVAERQNAAVHDAYGMTMWSRRQTPRRPGGFPPGRQGRTASPTRRVSSWSARLLLVDV